MIVTVLLSSGGLRLNASVFRLGFLVKLESPGKRCRTLISSVVFFAFLFQLFNYLGGEASDLGVPPLPANVSHRGRQVFGL